MSTQYLVLGFKRTSFSTGVSSNEPLDKGYRQPQRYARLTSTKMHFFILFFFHEIEAPRSVQMS